jgi:hypothetical protein
MSHLATHAGNVLTSRQERLEEAVVRVLRAGGTRSELRERVTEWVDYLRMCGATHAEVSGLMRACVSRTAPWMTRDSDATVGEPASDRLGMMLRWSATRFDRAD